MPPEPPGFHLIGIHPGETLKGPALPKNFFAFLFRQLFDQSLDVRRPDDWIFHRFLLFLCRTRKALTTSSCGTPRPAAISASDFSIIRRKAGSFSISSNRFSSAYCLSASLTTALRLPERFPAKSSSIFSVFRSRTICMRVATIHLENQLHAQRNQPLRRARLNRRQLRPVNLVIQRIPLHRHSPRRANQSLQLRPRGK